MITTNGKNIVAKYLLNQAPEFASHIAVGVGGKAYPTSSSATFSASVQSLEFEVARVPILSKGLLKENDNEGNPVEKIVFKAELPIEQRYQITELGLYPAAANAVAGNFDSRIISTFSNSEPWSYSNNLNNSGTVLYIGPVQIDNVNIGDLGINNLDDNNNPIWKDFVFINSNSPFFEYSDRINRGEPPRYLSRSLSVSGSTSVVSGVSASSSLINTSSSASYYIENNSINLNLGKNLPTDQIKLAFSVVSLARDGVAAEAPDNVKIRLEFLNNSGVSTSRAYVNIALQDIDAIDPEKSLDNSRYQVVTRSLSEFTTTENFSWSSVNGVRIYTSIHDDYNVATGEHFVFYDGLRFENVSSYNPLYSLVAAEYIKTLDQNPILKRENSTSYIEYRFGIGVGTGAS
jgi:hypothetical protein